MSQSAAPAPEQKRSNLSAVSAGTGAPGWLLPLYLGGLALVLLGERALSGLEKGSGFVTALGVVAVVAATALRFSPKFKSQGERANIERLLALLSVLGLVALAIYYVTTDAGAERVGISKLATEKRDHTLELLRVLWVSLLTLGVVPQIFAETALRPMRRAERPEARRVSAAAMAGGSLAMVVVYGSLLVYASGGIQKKWDYSYFKTSRPGEATVKIASSLSEPIRVVAFFPEVNEVKTEVQSYLKELAASSPKLKVEMKDRLLAPKLAKELRASQDGVIILSKGSATYTLNVGADMNSARAKLLTLDRDFQEQLLKAVRSHKTVYFTVGHGELNDAPKGSSEKEGRTANLVKLLLQKQNVTVKDLGLGQGLGSDVPADADAVVVLGPSEAFAAEEIASLQRFADKGGHLLLALDPESSSEMNLVTAEEGKAAVEGTSAAPTTAPSAAPAAKPAAPAASGSAAGKAPAPPAPKTPAPPHLAALVGITGLTLAPDLLANETQHITVRANDSDRTRLQVNSFSSHASVSTLSRAAPRAAIVVFGSGSLEKPQNLTGKVDFTVKTPSGTFNDANKNFKLDKDAEKTQVYNIAAAVTRPVAGAPAAPPPKPDDKDKGKDKKPEVKEMRAFVTADVDAFSDLVLTNVVGNQVLFVDAMRWLVGEESYAGRTNTEEDLHIEHTKQQDLAWFYSTIFGIPALVLGAGLFIRRRLLAGGAK
ncbi:MAG TPA: Gldg family protein [Polyangiaceae bacterium]|nr:Gldg family protein [Polyangiaceae bacterium]